MRSDVPAQTLDHFFDDMVGADADAVTQQLHGQMPVAEMPGDADQFAVFVRVDLHQLFRLGADSHDPGFDHQPVAVAQANGLRQVDQQFRAQLRSPERCGGGSGGRSRS